MIEYQSLIDSTKMQQGQVVCVQNGISGSFKGISGKIYVMGIQYIK